MRITILVIFSIVTGYASACSCGSISIERVFENAEKVVIVRVSSIKEKVSMRECFDLTTDKSTKCEELYLVADVEFVNSIKGDQPGKVSVIGIPETDGCHEPMEIDDTLVLFLHSNSTTTYNSCTANRLLQFIDPKIIEKWKSKKALTKT